MTLITWAQPSGAALHIYAIDCIIIALTLIPFIVVSIIALPRILQDVPGIRRLLHALFPLTQAAFISVQLHYALATDDWAYVAVLIGCSLVCALIDMALVKHLIASEQRDKQNDRLHLLNLQTEAQQQRMREFNEDTEWVRDDYCQLLRKLDDLDQTLRNGSSVNQIEHSVHDAADVLCAHTTRICDNLVVDALLSMKMQEARRTGVDFHCDVQVSSSTPLSDVELCAVFANLCDNALHACERMGAPDADESNDANESDCADESNNAAEGCGASAAESADTAEGAINAEAADVRRPWIRVRARIDESHCIVNVTNSCAMGTPPPRPFPSRRTFPSWRTFRFRRTFPPPLDSRTRLGPADPRLDRRETRRHVQLGARPRPLARAVQLLMSVRRPDVSSTAPVGLNSPCAVP